MDVDTPKEKKCVNKAKSHINGPSVKTTEPTKRKSFNANEAVRSLDVALGRLKKSKLVDGEYSSPAHSSPVRRSLTSAHMFIDSLTEPNYNHEIDSTSLMSMNFSHYELMRNLSCSTNSDGAFSSTTCNALSMSDITSKNEHLERYFRSVDTWGRYTEQFPAQTSTSDSFNIDPK